MRSGVLPALVTLVALVALALLGAGCSTATGPTPPEPAVAAGAWSATGDAARVYDGDTFDLRTRERGVVRIRFAGIDAPERGQAYSRVATDYLRLLLSQGAVTVHCSKTDDYKRDICSVSAAGAAIGLEMIRAGLAWHFKRFEHEQEPEARRMYAEAEEEARRARKGLWGFAEPMAPWDCRRAKREGGGCR